MLEPETTTAVATAYGSRERSRKQLVVVIFFGLLAGLVEGCLLILFQRLNWRSWGTMLHVSAPIVWISPIVDVVIFGVSTAIVMIAVRIIRREAVFAVCLFWLAFLTAYDWLTCAGRLRHWACFLLAIGLASVFTRWAARHESSLAKFCGWAAPISVALVVIVFFAIHIRTIRQEKRDLGYYPPAAPGSPNVLLVVIDTLRADHVSAYGYPRQTSPTLDRLAREGVLFENAIAPAPWSLPSHVSLVTGRYQFEHGIGDVPAMSLHGLRAPAMNGFITLGQALEWHGYRTAAFSANRTYFSANLGFFRGFNHFEDYFDSVADCFVRTLYGREFARVYLTRTDHSAVRRLIRWLGWESLLDKDDEGAAPGGTQGVRKRAPEVNRETLRWLDSSPHERPFFVMLNYFDVHHRYGGPVSFHGPWTQKHGLADDRGPTTDDSAEASQRVIDAYDNGIKYDDDALADLLRALEERGLLKNTLVIITSDHGESLGEHHIAYHGEALYREQIHVPLVFWFPGHLPAGIRVGAVATNASIPATVISLFGHKRVGQFLRPSLEPLWNGNSTETDQFALSEVDQICPTAAEDLVSEKFVPTSMQGAMKSLTTRQWQLIAHQKYPTQLYDYRADPRELTDLAGQSAWASQVEDLTRKMNLITTVPKK